MMRGFIVIVTAAMAMIFLGKKQYCHHYLSMLTIMSGVALVGFFNVKYSEDQKSGDDSKETPTKPLGIVLLLIAQCFTGFQFITEEKLLSGYYLDPFYAVGLEGLWGCLGFCIILPVLQTVKCDPDTNTLCGDEGTYEDTPQAIDDMKYNPTIFYYTLL